MTAVARHADPVTSHEAAATVDLCRSQAAVLTFIRTNGRVFFTDADLVDAYQARHTQPVLSPSRIRTARLELAAGGRVFYAGIIRRPGRRREQVWSIDPDAAMERRITTQDDAA